MLKAPPAGGTSKRVGFPISIRLDPEVQEALEAEAKARGLGLATLLRQLAADAAREIRRQRIRQQSKAVGEYVAQSAEAAEYYREWGTPRSEGG